MTLSTNESAQSEFWVQRDGRVQTEEVKQEIMVNMWED